ncbi:MAG: radical SAM protein [candidate division Zixibacteria bacterium]|nr:radical SAM protein [candidate division Zixibacteria bacterium]
MQPDAHDLFVNEIYVSLQGESSHAGLPCVFVRLTGCNLRCTWCDTEYAFYEGKRRSVDDVVQEVESHEVRLVEITGGEPLLQKGCVTLAARLQEKGKIVLVETSGAQPINVLPAGVIRIMDLKCPSTGECDKNDWDNIAHLNAKDEVKFVIGDRADYDWARQIMERHQLPQRCLVLISTVFGAIEPRIVADWMLQDRLEARFQLQMHKYIWDPVARGV